jgi:hypothetical protein
MPLPAAVLDPVTGKYLVVDATGYVRIYDAPPTPATWMKYQLQHRAVMEEQLKRKLLAAEIIHHIDGNRQNNALENLKLVADHLQHIREEHPSWRMGKMASLKLDIDTRVAQKLEKLAMFRQVDALNLATAASRPAEMEFLRRMARHRANAVGGSITSPDLRIPLIGAGGVNPSSPTRLPGVTSGVRQLKDRGNIEVPKARISRRVIRQFSDSPATLAQHKSNVSPMIGNVPVEEVGQEDVLSNAMRGVDRFARQVESTGEFDPGYQPTMAPGTELMKMLRKRTSLDSPEKLRAWMMGNAMKRRGAVKRMSAEYPDTLRDLEFRFRSGAHESDPLPIGQGDIDRLEVDLSDPVMAGLLDLFQGKDLSPAAIRERLQRHHKPVGDRFSGNPLMENADDMLGGMMGIEDALAQLKASPGTTESHSPIVLSTDGSMQSLNPIFWGHSANLAEQQGALPVGASPQRTSRLLDRISPLLTLGFAAPRQP